MKLTADRVLVAMPVLDRIIAEKRPLTIKGAYRIARMHAKLLPEFRILEDRRIEMIKAYGYEAVPEDPKLGTEKVPTVPDDKIEEYVVAWNQVAAEEITFADLLPIPLAYLGPADAESPVTAAEMLLLGELLVDDSDQPPAELPKAA